MRIEAFIIAVLASAIIWVGSFDGARHVYRDAQHAGVVPNFHIKNELKELLQFPTIT
jgi:hypothetical protein